MHRICVFCGSKHGLRPAYAEAARRMGQALARRRLELVYGGGHIGLMGVVAAAAMAAGGHVIGVLPQALVDKELAHRGLPDLQVVASMHERKARMAELSDAFVALPGGFGTLEELCEMLTWSQLGFHQKPCGLLNVDGFFDPLLALFDHAEREKFISRKNRARVLVEVQPEPLLDLLAAYRPPAVEPLISREQT